MPPESKKPVSSRRMQVKLPAGLNPTYANFALITNSVSEIVIDFAQVMPQVPEARIQTRLVMTPYNAKLLLRALGDHLGRYEAEHGEINIPAGTSLADQLFKPPPGPDGPDEEES